MVTPLSGSYVEPSSGKTDALVMFLHGLGADRNDLLSLAPIMAEHLPNTRFFSPDAPFACDMAPYGYQWFSMQDRRTQALYAGVEQAEPYLNATIDALLEQHALPANRLIVLGFSQGCMMALHTPPRRAEAVAGVIGISGGMVNSATLPLATRSRPPVCLIHGDADTVVPVAAMADAQAALIKADIPVSAYTRPNLAHAIDEQGLSIALQFIQDVLDK